MRSGETEGGIEEGTREHRPFDRTRDASGSPARLARREAKSELAQVRAHHALVLAITPTQVNLWMSDVGQNRSFDWATINVYGWRTARILTEFNHWASLCRRQG